MIVQENKSLKDYNTFGIACYAEFFISVQNVSELKEALSFAQQKNLGSLFLGGGSNILFTKDYKGVVIRLDLKGKEVCFLDDDFAEVTASAGENWHKFVLWTLEQNLGGLENLSLIPGNVGTCPIQNIGAYGVEIKDRLISLQFLEIETAQIKTFGLEDCQFGYRDSIFKRELKGKVVILSVTFKLTRKNHELKTSYGAIQNQLQEDNIVEIHPKSISDAVIKIRQSKLPDPNKLGNAGSFFKNPIVEKSFAESFKLKFPEAPVYEVSNDKCKLAAGWLIDKAGWKGAEMGNAKVHDKQALVLINNGKKTGQNVSGEEVWVLSAAIVQDVYQKFGVTLEREVNIL